MKYLLDTNTWATFLNDPHSNVAHRIELTPLEDLVFCSIVKAELWYGAHKGSRRKTNLKTLGDLFAKFQSLPFDDAAAEICGKIRADLAKLGQPIGPNDLMIAAITLLRDLTLVTHNTAEFSRVVGLKLEDWQVT
jgi:tRNA(fMet)-specific endonuclease VapC